MAVKQKKSTEQPQTSHFSYERTLLWGRYRDELGRGAAKTDNVVDGEGVRHLPPPKPHKKPGICSCCPSSKVKWRATIKRLVGEDWLFLALLGVIMAFLSFLMDFIIEEIQSIHMWLYKEVSGGSVGYQYLSWVSYTVVLVLFSVGFVAVIAPQAIGSGIPEMKTILRGVVLKEYLTWRTLIAKMVGLTVSLGSGLPVGKEGPFVHVASIVACLLSNFVTSFKGIFENESRSSEMLAAACAVGVACTFAAPVGGVLFSIEVTSVYFAVRNYWRGFFAAACSATVFRLLAVGFKKEVTVVAFYQTSFPGDTPFYPEELIPFCLIGVACGFGGALFVYTHRSIVLFMRNNRYAKFILQKNRFLYPAAAAILISTMFFPPGYGQFIAGELTFRRAINDLFTNFSWNDPVKLNVEQMEVVKHWSLSTNIYLSLTLYCMAIFFLGSIANTLPLPAGVFIPVFVIGAAFGRLTGEAMAAWFPLGLRYGSPVRIIPGGYAVVGAAAFTGSVTHTVSVSVIVFELTGQLTYILPVMLAVLLSNAICAYLQPSIYDSMIQIKHLPYLPDILPTSSVVHSIQVENVMVKKVKYLSTESTFEELQDLLIKMPRLRAFPLVDKPESMILLGSIPRVQLNRILEEKVGKEARREAALRWRLSRPTPPPNFTSSTPGSSDPEASSRPLMNPRVQRLSLEDHFKPRTDSTASIQEGRDRSESTRSNASASRFTVSRVDEKAAEPEASPSPEVDRRFLAIPSMSGFSVHQSDIQSSPRRPRRSLPEIDGSNTVTGVYNTVGAYMKTLARRLRNRQRYKDEEEEDEIDLTEEERKIWESEQLSEKLDFEQIKVDAAPFQLVSSTSLYKVHSLFSLLGLNRAYVTALGRLVGVVALRELRHALEHAQRGGLFTESETDSRNSSPPISHFEIPPDIQLENQIPQDAIERTRSNSSSSDSSDILDDVNQNAMGGPKIVHRDSLLRAQEKPKITVHSSSPEPPTRKTMLDTENSDNNNP